MTKLSIIMPVYNNEKYFPIAVKSVENQNYDNYELIVIDDGSTDRTPQIADALAEKNSHIKVIHQNNQWIYNSFNSGIAVATGEYIYILNSDDCLLPGVFELFERNINMYHPDIIWTKVLIHICDVEQNIILYDKYNLDRSIEKDYFYAQKEEVEKGWPFFLSSRLAKNQANLYRREIMQNQLFRNDVYGADTLYNIAIADKINSALVLRQPVYFQYIYENDLMNISNGKYYSYEHAMFNEIFSQYKSLFQKWKLASFEYENILCKRRMKDLSVELRNLQAKNCPLSLEEKLQFAFSGCIDGIIEECASKNNRQEELESRILSAVRELIIKEPIDKESKMYFVYELLESLLCYEKEEGDFRKIEHAINHPLNPLHIGNTFYKKLIDGRKGEQGGTISKDV
ncbi:MAG: glycosyltransferase family 2 protein [Hungatella sp.]|jgi:glycosyltransferase involved in cell wall biosynthesis|nr:glycosyltransferase family 2 protein [Hungatella sp.]